MDRAGIMVAERLGGSLALPAAVDASRFIWPTLALVAALLLGAFIISLVEKWRRRSRDRSLSAGDQLSHFRRLYEEGTITREEFERIKAQLAGDLRRELNVHQELKVGPPDASTSSAPPGSQFLPEPPDNGQPK
jgi:hypothetical protein